MCTDFSATNPLVLCISTSNLFSTCRDQSFSTKPIVEVGFTAQPGFPWSKPGDVLFNPCSFFPAPYSYSTFWRGLGPGEFVLVGHLLVIASDLQGLTGVTILPTQTSSTIIREISQNHHWFALFDPPNMGNDPFLRRGIQKSWVWQRRYDLWKNGYYSFYSYCKSSIFKESGIFS